MANKVPLPFITVTPDMKFSLTKEAEAWLSSINEPIGIIAVAGLARTGKSYLLNRLNNEQRGFEVGPSINPCTKGIYIWGTPMSHVTSTGEKITLLLIDTEGIGGTDRRKTHDAKIFCLALLLSSYFIYNSLGTIDEQAIEGISLIANLTKHIHVRSQGGPSGQDLNMYLPKFLWVVRDFILELEDESGNPISSQQYLERALQPTQARKNETAAEKSARDEKNKVREVIRSFFWNRDCTTLVRPVNEERLLRKIDQLSYDQLRKEFKDQMAALKEKIFKEVPPKTVHGRPIDGGAFLVLAKAYIKAINEGAVPTINSAWESVVNVQGQKAVSEATEIYRQNLEKTFAQQKGVPFEDEQFEKAAQSCAELAYQHFNKVAIGLAQDNHLSVLNKKLEEIKKSTATKNAEDTTNVCKALIEQLSVTIQTKVRAGQYQTYHDLVSDWSVVATQYLQKAKGTKAEKAIVGWEFAKAKLTAWAIPIFEKQRADIQEIEKKRVEDREKVHKAELAMESIKRERDTAISEAKQKAEQIKMLQDQLTAASNNFNEMKADLKRANEDLLKVKQERAGLDAEVQAYKRERDTLNSSLTQVRSESANLLNQNMKLDSELKRLSKKERDLTKEISAKVEDLRKATEKMTQLEKTIAQQVPFKEVKVLRQRELDFEEECERRTKELDEREQKMQSKQMELNASRAELEEMKEKIAEREEQLNKREYQLQQKQLKLQEETLRRQGGQQQYGIQSTVAYYRFSMIQRVTSNFDETKEIGRGGFGRVYKARIGRLDMAIKRMENERDVVEFLQEISVASNCRHSSILPLLGFTIERKEKCLVYPLMSCNLEQRLCSSVKRLDCQRRVHIAIQIAEAVSYLHNTEEGDRPSIFHRDIKAANILLDNKDNAKLSDVGLAKYDHTGTSRRTGWIGTAGCIDPLYLSSRQYEAGSDVFSFGVVLLQLLTGKPAFASENEPTLHIIMRRAFRRDPTTTTAINHADPKSGYWSISVASSLARIAMDCTTLEDIEDRPTMKEVVERLESIAMEFEPTSNPPSEMESENEMCRVCMIQPISNECVFEPCNHAVTCEECALEINSKEGTNRCPECNRRVTGIK